MSPTAGLFVIVLTSCTAATVANASETDQFTGRSQYIRDSTHVLNNKVNTALADIVHNADPDYDEKAIIREFNRQLGGRSIVDRIEQWAVESSEVQLLPTTRRNSIYGGLPFWSTRGIFLFPFGRTLRVNNQLIGSDKLSHFISQGRKFYRRYVRYGTEEFAIRRAAFVESGIFGSLTTGTFSNADLVANYEGYLFYRSLFEDDVVHGKPAILRSTDDGWVMQRKFDWGDHVNEYWDEALNTNHYDRLLRGHIKDRLLQFCPQFSEDPSLYAIEHEDELILRYQSLKLRDGSEYRLENICIE